MTRIAFILLCHKDPDGVIRQAKSLAEVGDCVAIHFDGRASAENFARLRQGLEGVAGVTFAARRIKCGWGEWSLVAATLEAVRAARQAFPDATHYYMISGDCMAIKSAEYAHAVLAAEDVDHIESVDFHESGWIKTGIREERLVYRHVFNERTRKPLFYASLNLQRRLGLRRRVPADLRMMIGSQWWCLRRSTIDKILAFCKARPDVLRFFRTTWIPDETFFQTLVRHLVPAAEIRSRSLTFLSFTDYGLPTTFHNDHYEFLLSQDSLFARKISADALGLRDKLGELYAERGHRFAVSGEGRRMVALLTGLGREGRRFGACAWEEGMRIGRERQLLILTSKKWHVAKRLAAAARDVAGITALGHVFDEADTPMPDLGGTERTLDKRGRHRRSVLRMLYDHHGTDRLAICLDTSNLDLIRDCAGDGVEVRVLDIDLDYDDAYLEGHARRVGLAGAGTHPATLSALLPAIRRQFRLESDRLAAIPGIALHRIADRAATETNSAAIGRFLSLPDDRAREIAETPHLFAD